MAHIYGPAKHPERCAPKNAEVCSVRSWHGPATVDLVVRLHATLDKQVLRLERKEAEALTEALRRVLAHDGSISWSPSSILDESKRG